MLLISSTKDSRWNLKTSTEQVVDCLTKDGIIFLLTRVFFRPIPQYDNCGGGCGNLGGDSLAKS